MQSAERNALADDSLALARKVQANDQAGVQAATIPEFASNFSGIASAITTVSPKLAGKSAEVEQVYILDASSNTRNADGTFPNAEFFCTLNGGKNAEADFSIPGLPPGRYAFAMVDFVGSSPWTLSMLLRQDSSGSPWKLAGLFPKEDSAAGHDGLWYWRQGRTMAASKEPWVAYIYYQQARQLLQPAVFVSSTHLESLRSESSNALPPELANGISADSPLLVKGDDGTAYRFFSIAPDNGLHADKLDIAIHMQMDPSITDPAVAEKRNRDAMSAFLKQHPALRQNFRGVWVFAEAPNRPPVTTVAAMNEIH
ncbi:protein kinase family protein [Terriglobus albidus]|uniref:hypothetical protein n=1 Tax=Terriglobus albidus TaxID=1592106 RepID=UPI0021E08150|nr:hypothetical protein [Terriglobus albidus]